MKAPSALAILLLGVAFGAGLIVACSDDSPPDADAAVCDCPAAEPPLAGRIVASERVSANIIPGNGGGTGIQCPEGATLLGGSCRLEVSDRLVTLMEAGADRSVPPVVSWRCEWSSSSTMARIGYAEAICLMPPQ